MLKGILSISGQPGLFKLVAETKNRIIVESLATGKRMPANPTAKIISLEDIAVFTASGDIPLNDILKKIHLHENGGVSIDSKSPDKDIRKYFEILVPDYDQDKVYLSDIKKIILWYNILQGKNLLDFKEEVKEPDDQADSQTDVAVSE